MNLGSLPCFPSEGCCDWWELTQVLSLSYPISRMGAVVCSVSLDFSGLDLRMRRPSVWGVVSQALLCFPPPTLCVSHVPYFPCQLGGLEGKFVQGC